MLSDNKYREYSDLEKELYSFLVKKCIKYAKYQKSAKDKQYQYTFDIMHMLALKSKLGLELNAENPRYFDRVVSDVDKYLTALGDKDSVEYKTYRKNYNDKYNYLKKYQKMMQGEYMSATERNRLIGKNKSDKNYAKVVEAIELCNKVNIKPSIAKLMEISGLGKNSVVKYKKQYKNSLNLE